MSTPRPGATMVIGGTGWIGRELAAQAARRGPVVIGSRRPASPGTVRVTSQDQLERTLHDHDVRLVVSCAGLIAGDEAALHAANSALPDLVGRACLARSVPLVHVGSAAEYGVPVRTLVAETDPTSPVSSYGTSKLAGTQALLDLSERGLDVVVARVFNVVGPDQPRTTPTGEFVEAVRALPDADGVVTVRDASLVRDFVGLRWVAHALLALGEVEDPPHVVNVCSGVGHSFHDVITALADHRGVPVTIQSTSPGGIPRVVGDPSLLRRLVAGLPAESLEDLAEQMLGSR
ncbi:MAG TPA: NAD-dependent epimerase/dehydratase family protein [Actinomycetes bacterium]|nr:NAD-dependent epimerase/dehydratase family protein [Actinomycetes bacterium]